MPDTRPAIVKELKSYTWQFNPNTKELTISRYLTDGTDAAVETVTIDKIRMFSLFRFLIRISQKMSTHPRHAK